MDLIAFRRLATGKFFRSLAEHFIFVVPRIIHTEGLFTISGQTQLPADVCVCVTTHAIQCEGKTEGHYALCLKHQKEKIICGRDFFVKNLASSETLSVCIEGFIRKQRTF